MDQGEHYIGLMSGTSIDGIDAALVRFDPLPTLIAVESVPIPLALRQQILDLSQPGGDHIDFLGNCDQQLGQLFARAVNLLLDKSGLNASNITAIGSHGQTVRHRPPGSTDFPFSLQIGDPNQIACHTGITTVADFRRKDMAAGGEGAPLVPAFHQAVFHCAEKNRAVLNLGGIANVTWLPPSGEATGFDTGPANVLMDAWIQLHSDKTFDEDGNWAATGDVAPRLLDCLLSHPFLKRKAPKSTGREDFNLLWLESILQQLGGQFSPEDVQATLLEFTAVTCSQQIKGLAGVEEVFACGGGSENIQLMKRIQQLLPSCRVSTTSELGVDPHWLEAICFAWLARQTLNRLSGNLPAVTGASKACILGGIYLAG